MHELDVDDKEFIRKIRQREIFKAKGVGHILES